MSYDEREIPFDLLVTVPLNMGADFVARSGLGDELNYVPVDKHTLLSTAHDNIFAVGDASNIPASKAGSVAHFSVEVFVDNFLAAGRGPADDRSLRRPRQLLHRVRRRQGAADRLQLRHRAAARQVPDADVGPLEPARETRANHLGQAGVPLDLLERPAARSPVPLPAQMSMAGKHVPRRTSEEE